MCLVPRPTTCPQNLFWFSLLWSSCRLGMPAMDILKRFDAYPKLSYEELSKYSLAGAAVTIASSLVIIILVVLEFNAFMTLEVKEELFVDTTRNHKLQINLDITMPKISCDYLSLDAMALDGEQHLHIEHNVFKRRLDLEGKVIVDAEPEKHDVKLSSTEKKVPGNGTVAADVPLAEEAKQPVCGSCYGANRTCCNTCQDVIDAYRGMGWNVDMDNIEQCKDQKGRSKSAAVDMKEGCQVYGHMEVNRIGGSFHIAPGKSFSINHIHVHDVQPYSSSSFNTSHIVNHLSFGQRMSYAKTHLDDMRVIETETAMMFQYHIKIVPTMLEKKETGETIFSNQFSVTTHKKSVSPASGESGMPGVFFNYELSPLMVKYTESKKSLGHFLTNVCSIVGGIFTVAGILYTFLDTSIHAIRKKIELGKFN